jgi:hypothetical protein
MPLNVIPPARSELNQPRFAVVHPVNLAILQPANPKAPLKVLTPAEKPSPLMFAVPLTDDDPLTRVALPLTLLIMTGSPRTADKGKNPRMTTANNLRNRDV